MIQLLSLLEVPLLGNQKLTGCDAEDEAPRRWQKSLPACGRQGCAWNIDIDIDIDIDCFCYLHIFYT